MKNGKAPAKQESEDDDDESGALCVRVIYIRVATNDCFHDLLVGLEFFLINWGEDFQCHFCLL